MLNICKINKNQSKNCIGVYFNYFIKKNKGREAKKFMKLGRNSLRGRRSKKLDFPWVLPYHPVQNSNSMYRK